MDNEIIIDEEMDYTPYVPTKNTRTVEQLIGIVSLVNEDKETDEILEILDMNIIVLRSLYRKIPSLPRPSDWADYE